MAAGPLRVVVRPRADADVDAVIDHDRSEAGVAIAERFATALTQALGRLSRSPGLGSMRYAELLSLPGLRAWPLRPWPYIVFYLAGDVTLDVVRVLHGARDISATLAGDEGSAAG